MRGLDSGCDTKNVSTFQSYMTIIYVLFPIFPLHFLALLRGLFFELFIYWCFFQKKGVDHDSKDVYGEMSRTHDAIQ